MPSIYTAEFFSSGNPSSSFQKHGIPDQRASTISESGVFIVQNPNTSMAFKYMKDNIATLAWATKNAKGRITKCHQVNYFMDVSANDVRLQPPELMITDFIADAEVMAGLGMKKVTQTRGNAWIGHPQVGEFRKIMAMSPPMNKPTPVNAVNPLGYFAYIKCMQGLVTTI